LRDEKGVLRASYKSRSLGLGLLTVREGGSGGREEGEKRRKRQERKHREEGREVDGRREGRGEILMVVGC